jgi:hypothetical protein
MAGNNEARILSCPSETNWILATHPAYCRESNICLVTGCYYNLHVLKIIQVLYADIIKSVDIHMNDYYTDNQ